MRNRHGRTVRLFLVDGTPTGLIKAEIMNWSGKVLAGPRTDLATLLVQPECSRAGVYLLAGPAPDEPGRDKIYVGESEDVAKRIRDHDRRSDMDFFTRAVVVVSSDRNVTKAHARYLEAALISRLISADRAILHNGNAGAPVELPESDTADMEAFLDQLGLILPVVGVHAITPRAAPNAADEASRSPLFEFRAAGAHGRARQLGDRFVLLKGSTCRREGVASWTSFKALRDQLISRKRLIDHADDPALLVAVEDIELDSPSAAAAIVAGRNTNGREAWRVSGTSQTYQDWTVTASQSGARE